MASVKFGLDKKRKAGMQMAIGTAGMDMIYCMIAIFAAAAVQQAAAGFFDSNPVLMLVFQISIIVAFLAYGTYSLISLKKKAQTTPLKQKNDSKYIQNLKSKGPFLLGIALALTNIANPTFLPSLAITASWVHKTGVFMNSFGNNLLYSIGFGIGNFIWLYVLTSLVAKYRHRMSDNFVARITQFAGVTFIGFSGILSYRVVMFTKWPEILRLVFAF